MTALDAGLQVRHIAATPLISCEADDDVAETFQRFTDFDQIPVMRDGRLIGVVERPATPAPGPALEHLRYLDDALLISADAPLSSVFDLLGSEPHYRLVVDGAHVNAIIDRSDLVKLPVRPVVFLLITHLELVMAGLIAARCPEDEQWLGLLKDGRRSKVLEKHKQLKTERSEPPLLEMTDFSDKRDIVRKLFKLGKRFKTDLERIENLRNTLVHAGSIAGNLAEREQLLRDVRATRKWIAELDRLRAGRSDTQDDTVTQE
ncbi:MAG: CBS domain-containing protein [Dehalococcoidia bacterium]